MTIHIIHTIHPPRDERLPEVIEEMKIRGRPLIEVVNCEDHYFACEGCNRIEAARLLGLLPEWKVFQMSDTLPALFDAQIVGGSQTGAEFVAANRSDKNGIYEICDGKLRIERVSYWFSPNDYKPRQEPINGN